MITKKAILYFSDKPLDQNQESNVCDMVNNLRDYPPEVYDIVTFSEDSAYEPTLVIKEIETREVVAIAISREVDEIAFIDAADLIEKRGIIMLQFDPELIQNSEETLDYFFEDDCNSENSEVVDTSCLRVLRVSNKNLDQTELENHIRECCLGEGVSRYTIYHTLRDSLYSPMGIKEVVLKEGIHVIILDTNPPKEVVKELIEELSDLKVSVMELPD